MKPKGNARAQFQHDVDIRGVILRKLSRDELVKAGERPVEELVVQGRRGTVCNIVEQMDDGSLRVVVQGFLYWRLLPFGCEVALDGFYKRPNGEIEPLADDEYYEFD